MLTNSSRVEKPHLEIIAFKTELSDVKDQSPHCEFSFKKLSKVRMEIQRTAKGNHGA